jgi:hypothetical protein
MAGRRFALFSSWTACRSFFLALDWCWKLNHALSLSNLLLAM